jgi:prepilin-type N-terminal cleavage/methylation domain-containing protein
MKAFKNMGFGPRKSKSGFTLIELLIVMVILAILAGVVVMAVGGVFGTARGSAYTSVKDDLQNAVTGYATDHNGNFPFNTSASTFTVTGCSTCYVLNFNVMLTSGGGMLREVPDGATSYTGAGYSTVNNCTNGSITGCDAANHYKWGADSLGNVFSVCCNVSGQTTACTANQSGYQGVWP